MPHIIEAPLNARDFKFAIAISRFNDFVGKNLLDGAINALKKHGASDDQISVVWVPGAYELPLIARTLAQRKNVDAIICLGAVIRGATSHYDLVIQEAAKGTAAVSSEFNIPVLFGVLTTENFEQAIDRSGGKLGNKGHEVAVAAVEMVNLMKILGNNR